MKKTVKLAVIECKHCHEKMGFNKINEIPDKCPKCGTLFEEEPVIKNIEYTPIEKDKSNPTVSLVQDACYLWMCTECGYTMWSKSPTFQQKCYVAYNENPPRYVDMVLMGGTPCFWQ